MKNKSVIIKLGLCYIGLFIVYLLQINTNNNPEPIIQSVIRPIKTSHGIISLTRITLIIIVFLLLTVINIIKGNLFTKTIKSRIASLVFLIIIFNAGAEIPLMIQKSFAKDLNSIYLNRESTSIKFIEEDDKLILRGKMTLKNYGDETQKFNIKVKKTKFAEKVSDEEYITLENEYVLNPKEMIAIDINEELRTKYLDEHFAFPSLAFEYILYNNDCEVIFKGYDDIYYFDERCEV